MLSCGKEEMNKTADKKWQKIQYISFGLERSGSGDRCSSDKVEQCICWPLSDKSETDGGEGGRLYVGPDQCFP